MKILLAVDGSAYTQKMLAYLTTHAEVFGPKSDYTLFTVQSPLLSRTREAVGKAVSDGYNADEAEKVTAPVVAFLQRHGIEAQVVHKVGSAGELIGKAAEAGGFDLVMMGSHGHSALGNLVMGSVATQVLAHCQVPVLLVR